MEIATADWLILINFSFFFSLLVSPFSRCEIGEVSEINTECRKEKILSLKKGHLIHIGGVSFNTQLPSQSFPKKESRKERILT